MRNARHSDSFDNRQIMHLLRHCYQFLLIDRIEQNRGEESCVSIKNVTINEPFFRGHFPSRPVMPAVLLLEGMAQSAGAICALSLKRERAPKLVYFITIDKAKFRRPIIPGDRVEYHMRKLAQRRNMW